jgi:hypothetical protein
MGTMSQAAKMAAMGTTPQLWSLPRSNPKQQNTHRGNHTQPRYDRDACKERR